MDWTLVINALIKITLIVMGFVMGLATVLTWAERKYSAVMQDRIGPNRANIGRFRLGGIFHMIADPIKMIFKEDFIPAEANPIMYRVAPFIAVVPPLVVFAVIPFGPGDACIISTASIGILFIFAISSLSVYGAVLGGWSSNNKFSLLGGLRVSAQMISYEVTLGLNLVGVFMVYESITLQEIIVEQGELLWGFLPAWGIVLQPVAFFLFITAATAESKRAPFDVAEAEPELVAGYHTEYSSMKFALFALGEFIEVVVIACITACVFLGGWQIPGVEPTDEFSVTTLMQIGAFLTKVVILCALQMTIRWTLPRFRYDQVMSVCWKYLLPLSLANILGTGVVLYCIA
jgi:NADH-quinone oxidoreductase subunit H